MPSAGDLEVPISSTLLLELTNMVPRLLSQQHSSSGKIPVDRHELDLFLELADDIRSEAGEPPN